ncbi:hypothetical protein K470DRAFT_258159 [Piedraia hortae CBS 480.64]|uniref:Uncharacterized protein n=1 Tax=Piedraia hortae CBS 480.64 TaxID=1314780 RepID=A0A6A7BYL3_9PEZI|nr:hypothetical protein K470DRAFT_258159 [Piedraia hortae CBS 480.64]
MPLRQRAKAFFHRRSRTDSSSSKPSCSGSNRDRWPSNVYKPGEPMPPPKYRRPPHKEHWENLERFTFDDSWRRKSFQSQYSPMGTRLPSRQNSILGRSVGDSDGPSRTASITGEDGFGVGDRRQRRRDLGFGGTRLSAEPEVEGDDDVGNVGLSRAQSREGPSARYMTAHDHTPFSEDDLSLALQQSQITVTAH